MTLTVLLILAILALLTTIFAVMKRESYPWSWAVPVFLICIYLLIDQLPVGNK